MLLLCVWQRSLGSSGESWEDGEGREDWPNPVGYGGMSLAQVPTGEGMGSGRGGPPLKQTPAPETSDVAAVLVPGSSEARAKAFRTSWAEHRAQGRARQPTSSLRPTSQEALGVREQA